MEAAAIYDRDGLEAGARCLEAALTSVGDTRKALLRATLRYLTKGGEGLRGSFAPSPTRERDTDRE